MSLTNAANSQSYCDKSCYLSFLPTALAREVMQSLPSLCPFPLYLSNRLTFGLDLLPVCGSLPWLAGIELKVTCQGQDAVTLTSISGRSTSCEV